MTPWGYKVTLHIYVKGPHPGDAIFAAARDASVTFKSRGHGVDFVGASIKEVQDEPKDQVAS